MGFETYKAGQPSLKTSAPPVFTKAEDNMRFAFLKDVNVQQAKKRKHEMSDMDTYSEVYKHSINHDKNKVKEARRNESPKSLHGELLSDILTFRMNDYDYFGKHAEITQTSDYDDKFKHTDLILKLANPDDLNNDEAAAHIAIDCTVSEDLEVLAKKIGFTSRQLASQEILPEIKYYKNKNGSSGIKNIPRVVVAIEKSRLDGLCKTMLLADNNSDSAIHSVKRNYIQLYILYEISSQLNQQLLFVTQKFTSHVKMERAWTGLSKAQIAIHKIIEQKENSLGVEISERAWKEFENSEVAMYLATEELSAASAAA